MSDSEKPEMRVYFVCRNMGGFLTVCEAVSEEEEAADGMIDVTRDLEHPDTAVALAKLIYPFLPKG